MDNDILIILSYTNTPQKVEILKQCISSLKKYNKKIILSTHSTIPEDVMSEVDYVIYDKENPLIYPQDFIGGVGSGMAFLELGFYYQNVPTPNNAYCVLTLMNNGVKMAHSLGYKNSHLIHYDCIFSDCDLINDNNQNLIDNDIICYRSEHHDHLIDPNFISVHNQSFLRTFDDINSKEDYAYNKDDDTFEIFLKLRFTSRNKTLIKSFKELNENNVTNIKRHGTFNGIVNEITGVNNYLDLVQDNSKNVYINFRNNDNLKEIKLNGIKYSIVSLLNIIKIPQSDLNKGIIFSIDSEGYNFEKKFDNNSDKGYCEIRDTSQLNMIEL